MTKDIRERKSERLYRIILWGIGEIFAISSLIYVAFTGNGTKILMCIFTALLLCMPYVAERIFHFKINTILFTFCMLYAIGPMLGHTYKLYYNLPWWDDLLHCSGGVVFAIFGVYLAKLINKGNKTNILTCAIFALCFSIAISAVWEFIEYGCDRLFSMDMQNDTVISAFDSYLLGAIKGETGSIENITEVIINGIPLGVGGYIDVGLIDTMSDMLIETLGAIVFVFFYLMDKERHPLISSIKNQNINKNRA